MLFIDASLALGSGPRAEDGLLQIQPPCAEDRIACPSDTAKKGNAENQ